MGEEFSSGSDRGDRGYTTDVSQGGEIAIPGDDVQPAGHHRCTHDAIDIYSQDITPERGGAILGISLTHVKRGGKIPFWGSAPSRATNIGNARFIDCYKLGGFVNC